MLKINGKYKIEISDGKEYTETFDIHVIDIKKDMTFVRPVYRISFDKYKGVYDYPMENVHHFIKNGKLV